MVAHIGLAAFTFGCRGDDDARAANQRRVSAIRGPVFGTTFEVKVARGGPGDAALRILVQQALAEVDATMSTYRQDSDISRFNRSVAHVPVRMSPLVFEVLAVAERVVRESGGAFDPTVGPMVRAWGFGPDPRPTTAPDLGPLLGRVGWSKLEIDRGRSTVTKARDGVEIDLSAVAKGFAVDRVFATLEASGATDFMVEVGGEVRARGNGPSGGPWRIGIEQPTEGHRSVLAVVSLDGQAMATSGDYRNYFEIDGKRVSHTIDPRTGHPIDHSLASVSVVADTCAEADAWATAINVLGPDEGFALAERAGVEVFMILRDGEAFVTRHSANFPLAGG